MKSFQYIVQNALGIHARPASQLIVKARGYQSELTVKKGDRIANPKSLMSVISLNVNRNDEITVTASGEDEAEAIAGLQVFMEENL